MSLADVLKAAAQESDPQTLEAVTILLNADRAARAKILGREPVYTTSDVERLGKLLALYEGVAPPVPFLDVNKAPDLPRAAGLAAVAGAVQSPPSPAPAGPLAGAQAASKPTV